MKLTAEQKSAFARANAACVVIKRATGQHVIRHPCRGLRGTTVETPAGYAYNVARQICAQIIAQSALQEIGWNGFDAGCAVADKTERALDIFKAALRSQESGK